MRPAAFVVLTLLLLPVTMTKPAGAGSGGLVVLVAGDEAAPDSFSRQDRAHLPVQAEIVRQLGALGYRVVGNLADHDDLDNNGRVRIADEEWLAAARMDIHPPADILVLVRIDAEARARAYSKSMATRLAARILDVPTGEHLGDTSVEMPAPRQLPLDCAAACLVGVAREQAASLGSGFAEAVTSVIEGGDTDRDWIIGIENFTFGDVDHIAEYLAAFPGFTSMERRDIHAGNVLVSYRSSASRTELQRNLMRMQEYLRLRGDLSLSGKGFVIRKLQPSAPP
ncbi:MAG: hypothetical protein RJQ21_08595 [Rhodospirillales bacterium]